MEARGPVSRANGPAGESSSEGEGGDTSKGLVDNRHERDQLGRTRARRSSRRRCLRRLEHHLENLPWHSKRGYLTRGTSFPGNELHCLRSCRENPWSARGSDRR
eukprot:401060-Hanusia_phi.AAC.3